MGTGSSVSLGCRYLGQGRDVDLARVDQVTEELLKIPETGLCRPGFATLKHAGNELLDVGALDIADLGRKPMGLKEPLELSNAVGVAGDRLIGQVAGQEALPGRNLGVERSDVWDPIHEVEGPR